MSAFELDLEKFDPAGAAEEALERTRISRRSLIRGAVLAGGVGVAALMRPAPAAALARRDEAILNYALVLEYLQASFYTEAERRRALTGDARTAARVVGAVERAHVKALKGVLGRAAVKRPFFDFRGTTEDPDAFLRTAVAFEDLATAAYKGQAPRIRSRQVLAAAISIHSVEARHAAWIRYLAGATPASDPFDRPQSMKQVLDLVSSTRFIVRRPRTRGRRKPRFTG
jgi:Ferritin-like domain